MIIENYLVIRLIDSKTLTRSYITCLQGRTLGPRGPTSFFWLISSLLCFSNSLALFLSPSHPSLQSVLAGSGRPINPIRHGSSRERAAVLQFMNLLWAPGTYREASAIDLSLHSSTMSTDFAVFECHQFLVKWPERRLKYSCENSNESRTMSYLF